MLVSIVTARRLKKLVESRAHIRRRFNAILLLGGELWHSALCSFSPLCPLIQRKQKHSSDCVAVRASGLELYEQVYRSERSSGA